MPRKATGSTWFDERNGYWVAIVTKPDKSRKWVPMKDLTDPNDRETAKRMATVVSSRYRDRGCVDAEAPDTLNEYFTRWATSREQRGLTSVSDDRGRFNKWIAPTLGARAIVQITPRDLEVLVNKLDVDVRAAKLSWKTAKEVWSVVAKLFDDVHRSKDLALRLRSDNPARDVRGPDRGDERAGTFISPAELSALLSCERVSTARRCIYAIGVYTGMRAGELCALTWNDVHEDAGYISVHHALNRKPKKHVLKSTKTGRARKVPIESELLPLLEMMRDRAEPTANVLPKTIASRKLPMFLREDLKAAGVERRELFDDTATTRKLDFHDLRHTYGTWRAIRGDGVQQIKFAMGHTTMKTTERYINEAHVFDRARFGVPFGPLPIESLAKRWNQRFNTRKHREREWVERDSNQNLDTASLLTITAETTPIALTKPSEPPREASERPSAQTLRAKLDAAIVAEAWDAVKAIRERIVEIERADVIDLDEARRRRGG